MPKAYILSKQAIIYWHQQMVTPHIGSHRFVTVSPSAVSTGILDDFVKAFGPMVPLIWPASAATVRRKRWHL